jgi:hypothetical protein
VRLVKASLFGLIVASLVMMWTNREFVTEAYQVTENPMQVRLSGVDLQIDPTDVGPSPFAVPVSPDTRRAALPVVAPAGPEEQEPVEIEMTGGKARLIGTVSGPDGPIAGATVGIQRVTSEGIGDLQVLTNGEGKWAADRMPGGTYRVRAWIPGISTSGGSEVRYLEEDEKAEFAFTILAVDPTPTIEFVHGGPIYAAHSGSVAMVMTSRVIDENGIVVTSPVVGALVTVQTTFGVTVATSPIQLTDANGTASFTLTCLGVASGGTITATSGVVSHTFSLPECRAIPEPEPVLPEPSESVSVDG